MEYRVLGNTGLLVSRLCFGALTIGPLQAKLPLQSGAAVIRAALDAGVNFIDTAELYGTYPYIKAAIRGATDVIVASKSYAYTYDDMRRSVEEACRAIGRDYIDIFLLHEQPSRLTLKGHADALAYLTDAKRQGTIRAAGVSTHTVEVARAAAEMAAVDVIHPLFNRRGVGIMDGTAEDMAAAVAAAAAAGKGVYTMKALGGGHLIKDAAAALSWVLASPGVCSVAVGMQSTDEVAYNCALVKGTSPDREIAGRLAGRTRRLLIEDWCAGCGRCADKCPAGALRLRDGRIAVDPAKCLCCGYCGAHCPEFCLKII
ncbi:aldo/keto reductase [Anaeroselena agilis]|uniref:Aldo/keto reductase n=1 Tax=Anaeroselena agilis TaxID=3063788 RepID=A0ABU3NXB1_9FIRM|nr:aldo/keto reductase [Selenomonadales bacterium 4137-cl]